jgi:predicted enzyme related to lactoylglutathione lyase
MKILLSIVVTMLISISTYGSGEEEKLKMNDKSITETTVMLYYSDLTAPRNFYKNQLGLDATYEDDWVSIYRLTSGSAVGLVLEGGTAYHKAKSDNAVMLSLTVDNVDAWYEKVKSAGISILKEIYNHPEVPIRAFLVEDPGGYTVEVFQWLK